MKYSYPRIVLAGNGGDAGKTMLAIGLLAYWRSAGRRVIGFKKGPDFIDAAWLTHASGSAAHNLDVYLMGEDWVQKSFVQHAAHADISLIEGNRGLFDGKDAMGTFSTAELAKLLQAPVLLLLDATKVTRTLAAFVLGCLQLDPELQIAGVVFNRIAGSRHEQVTRAAIEQITGVQVLGAIPKIVKYDLLPQRHLGLITPEEHGQISPACQELASMIKNCVEVAKIEEIARLAAKLEFLPESVEPLPQTNGKIRIGYFKDAAFTFYYPENLASLEKAGARLVPISPLHDATLPNLDALYIGGGFPETHAEQLAKNTLLLQEIKLAARWGLPIYAECGGLVFLSRSLRWGNEYYRLADVLPFDIEMRSKPAGHGYCEFLIEQQNPFFPAGAKIKGHEFHYSTIVSGLNEVKTAYQVLRGSSYLNGREGFIKNNVLASYFHLHVSSMPYWANSLIQAAQKFNLAKIKPDVLVD